MSRNSRAALQALKLAAVLLTTMTFAGCAPNAAKFEPPNRDLPPKPAELFEPVPKPPIRKGDNPKAKLAQTRDVVDELNGKLHAAGGWYDGVRSHYSGEAVQ